METSKTKIKVCGLKHPFEVKCAADYGARWYGMIFEKSSNDDQSRFLSPKEAFNMGSDFIVMGRPLINALAPNNIIKKIINN